MARKSMIGHWDSYYKDWPKGQIGLYGQGTLCLLGYEWMKDCSLIEDWGCGRGYFQWLCKPGQCVNLDCSCTPWADKQVDLVEYTSSVPGIMMRSVLEHNDEWETILRNALASFTERMALVIATPFGDRQIDVLVHPEAPFYSFSMSQITSVIDSCQAKWHFHDVPITDGMFPYEHIFYIWKEPAGSPRKREFEILAEHSKNPAELSRLYEPKQS